MIEKLLAPGSIPKLATGNCVLGKDTLFIFPLGRSSLPVVVAKPDERLANSIKKGALRLYG